MTQKIRMNKQSSRTCDSSPMPPDPATSYKGTKSCPAPSDATPTFTCSETQPTWHPGSQHSICRHALDQTSLHWNHTAARASTTTLAIYIERLLIRRSDYKDDGTNILLDANENAIGPGLALNKEGKLTNGASNTSGPSIDIDLLGLNRYPDP